MITQSEFNVKLNNILIDTKYVPEWVYKFAVKTNYIDITHKCFHIRIYKNNLNIVFVEKLKVLLTKLHDLLKLTNKRINIILLLSRKKKRINIGEIFKSENLDPFKYSVLCHDIWYETMIDGEKVHSDKPKDGYERKEQYAVRYEELFAFIVSAL